MSGITISTRRGDDGYMVRLDFDGHVYHLHPRVAREIARKLEDAADLADARGLASIG